MRKVLCLLVLFSGLTYAQETQYKYLSGKSADDNVEWDFFCSDGRRSVKWDKIIEEAISEGDSVGGIVECRCSNVPAGLGEPFFDSLESQLSHLLFSIPGVRGVEFGDGFAASRMKGSEHNDPIMDPTGKTGKNGAGGINGGISNGNPIVFRVAVKPTSSISKTQRSFNFTSGQIEEFNIKGRHDACIALRVPVIAEAVAAIVLANNL